MRAWTRPALAAVAALWLVHGGPVSAASTDCALRRNDTQQKLLECMTLDGVRTHQQALQHIANISRGNRFAGFQGHRRSVGYVAGLMRAAGYLVTVQKLDYVAATPIGPSILHQVSPDAVSYVEGTDFAVADQSDPGRVTAGVTAVDLKLGPGNRSTSGCEKADFAGFPAGDIALVQRGACDFEVKAENAAGAGASAVVIFNQGDTADRKALFEASVSAAYRGGIPVLMTSYPLGVAWSSTRGTRLQLFANVRRQTLTTANLLAETRGGSADHVVMVGAHLDSAAAGPGINDNGSGSAAILEVALQMKKVSPRNKVRFAWWTAEEAGLVGSTHYVDHLSAVARGRIALYLNVDMVGSPNPVRFVYDGDEGPPGSAAIERFLVRFFKVRSLATAPIPMDGQSDHGPFVAAGIATGGLYTGAEEVKTTAQAAIFGGTAGQPMDACYHKACDTIRNVDRQMLLLNARAVAAATLHYAMDVDDVVGTGARAAVALGAARSTTRRGPLVIR